MGFNFIDSHSCFPGLAALFRVTIAKPFHFSSSINNWDPAANFPDWENSNLSVLSKMFGSDSSSQASLFWSFLQGCQIRRESAHGESVCCNNVRALFDELPTPHVIVEITAFPAGPLTENDYAKAEKLERVLRSGPSIWSWTPWISGSDLSSLRP